MATENQKYTGTPYTSQFTGFQKVSTFTTWNTVQSVQSGVEMSFTASIPEVASVGGKVSLTLGTQESHGGSTTEESALSWSETVQITDSDVDVTAKCYQGNTDLSWTGMWNIEFASG